MRDGEAEIDNFLPQSARKTQRIYYKMKQTWNRNIVGIMIFMAAGLILPTFLYAGMAKCVIGKGEAAVVGITAEQGQLIALQRARADAVEKAVGTRVLGSTLVKNSVLVADFIKTFSRGFIVDEKVKWLPLGTFSENDKSAPIPLYRVEIKATIVIPERKDDHGFFLEASINRPSYLAGEKAVVRVKVSKRAHIAVFNMRADDRVAMLYPANKTSEKNELQPGITFCFPSHDSGLILEMATLNGHKQDSEAFMVTAVPASKDKAFCFADYFSADRLYLVPEFFEIYSRFAQDVEEQILPYEVKKRGQ